MTLETTSNKIIFQGNGATTVFTYSFIIPDAASVVAIYKDADGVETTLAPSQYTITGLNEDTGGTFTYPTSGSPIATGTTLTLQRIVPLVQEIQLENQGGYYPAVVEDAFDYLTMIDQQQQDQLDRTLTASATDPAGLTYTLPSAELRAEKFLYFDTDGNVSAADGAIGSGVVVTAPMVPVVGAATTAAALALLGGFPLAGGIVTGDTVFDGNVEVGGTFTVNGNEVTSTFPFSALRQWGAIANGTYMVVKMPYAFTITSMDYNVGSGGGSFTVALQIAGVSVTGLSAVAVSSATDANATATAGNTGAALAKITAVVSATTGSPVNAWISVRGTRTL